MRRKREDLTNQKFGHLIVIKKDETKKRYWLCQCDCGNENLISAFSSNLKSGTVSSCGCSYNRIVNLVGKIFGRLTVLQFDRRDGERTFWICQCNCKDKTIVSVDGGSLNCGNTKSCGCLKKEGSPLINKKYNSYDLSGEYGIGYTSNTNKQFYFDLEDYDKIKNYCWMEDKYGYISSYDYINKKHVKIHRIIMDVIDNPLIIIDHILHILHDNRKYQLRKVTKRSNNMNKKILKNNTSGITGVNWNNKKSKWVAQIGCNEGKIHKTIHLGYFVNFEDAVRVRKEAEEKYFGEYSYDNSMKLKLIEKP